MRAILAVLLAVVAFPVVAFAAPARRDGPAPAPVTVPAPAAGQAQPATRNVTNVTNNDVALPAMPSVQELAGGIFTQILILLLTGLANALQAVIGQAVGTGGPGAGGFIWRVPWLVFVHGRCRSPGVCPFQRAGMFGAAREQAELVAARTSLPTRRH